MIEPNGKTRLLGLVGYPLGHSLSPRIHNAAAESMQLNQIYVPFECELSGPDQAASFLQWSWQVGIRGFNITLPYKEMFAQVVGTTSRSINTCFRGPSGWQGRSTDGVGFENAVARMGLTGPVDQLVLLGNGGAARAIAEHYAQQKLCQGCHVIRRSPAKDDVWRDSLSQASLQFHDWAASALTEVCRKPGQTLVVQATSAPLAGHDLAEFADALPEFSGGLVDIVYGKPSKLVMAARRLGVPAQDGLPMLIEQARESQQSWWGRAADYDWLLHTVQQSISPS